MIDQVMNKELNYSGLEPRKFVFKPHLMYYLVFIGIAILYMLTLATTITATGDSSEMVVSPYVLGVAHPPGYPLYTMLGNLFTYIPLFNIAYRVNIKQGNISKQISQHGIKRITRRMSNPKHIR